MKKLFSSFLLFVLFIAQSQAASHQGLKAASDELMYSLTVEWDQKDPAFKEEQIGKFVSKVKELGLSNEELRDFTRATYPTKLSDKDISELVNITIQENMSDMEAIEFLAQAFQENQMQGSSWAPTFTQVAVALVGGFVIYAIIELHLNTPPGHF